MNVRNNVLKDNNVLIAKETQTGIMIALMLPDQLSRYISNKVSEIDFPAGSSVLPVNDHHITLLYFEQGEVNIDDLNQVLTQFQYDLFGYWVDYILNGIECFYNDKKALYIPVYSGSSTHNVVEFQRELTVRLSYGLNLPTAIVQRFTRFVPHVTVAYIPKEAEWNYYENLSGIMNHVYVSAESFSLVNQENRKDYKFGAIL